MPSAFHNLVDKFSDDEDEIEMPQNDQEDDSSDSIFVKTKRWLGKTMEKL
jgi:hypothetical protein